jgi:penicillin-binding protein 1A
MVPLNISPDKFVHFSKEKSEQQPPAAPGIDLTKPLFILLALVVLMGGCGLGAGALFFMRMHATLLSPDEIQTVEPPLVSKVYARDGSVIHEFSIEKRFWVPLNQMPENLRRAVIAIEDRRFYDHWGVDIHRIFGAFFANILRGEIAQGGSTITQQLARNLYLSFKQTMTRKIREALTAVQLEKYYTKDQILELYLNQVYFGAGVYGVEAASQRYFSKPVSQLDLNECSVLAGVIQLPEHHRPDKPENTARITARRKAVIHAMRAMNVISSAEAKAVLKSPVPNHPQKELARIAPYFIEMIRNHVERKYGEDQLYNGGLSIFTTLDPVAQAAAEDTMKVHLQWLQQKSDRIFLDYTQAHKKAGVTKDFYVAHFDSLYNLNRKQWEALPDSHRVRIVQGSVLALNAADGGITVMIGGRDFSESKFNRALQALRQPGSSFKPIVYTAAIDSSYTPASVVLDQPITLETPEGLWRPQNYEGEFNGPITIRNALKKSINLVAIQVIRDIGEQNVVDLARRMGLRHQLNPVPSLAIGSCEATLMEMTTAYSIFANGGRKLKPYFIEQIVDKNGRTLEEHTPEEETVLTPQTAFLMTSLLHTVVTSGTAASIPGMGFTRPAAGKTGTTNDYSDAWFVGFTPQAVCGVWTGVDERLSMGYGVTGTMAAIPIWVKTMKALHRSLPVVDFRQPAGIVTEKVCEKSNLLATPACPKTRNEVFIAGKLPQPCDEHGGKANAKNGNIIRLFGSPEKKVNTQQKSKTKKPLMF